MSELLTDEEVKQVFEIDDMILLNEFLALLDTALADNIPELLGKVQFSFNGFKETEEAHLSMLMMWTWSMGIRSSAALMLRSIPQRKRSPRIPFLR